MKTFDRYRGKGQKGSEKLNADFFLLIYKIQQKKHPQKEETIIHNLILLLAQKLSQNFEIILHLLLNIFMVYIFLENEGNIFFFCTKAWAIWNWRGGAERWTVQFSSVAQLYPTLCDPMNHSIPGFPVITNSWILPKLINWVGEAIKPSHPLSSLPLQPSIFPSIRVF